MMDQTKIMSKLLSVTVLEVKDDLDERLEKCGGVLQSLIAGKGEREGNEALQGYIHKGQLQHDEVQMGLFYGILTDPSCAIKFYRDITLTSKDGLMKVLTVSNQIIYEKWVKLLDSTRQQVLWFAKELVKNSVTGADSVIHSLIRQIAGGDVSPRNVYLSKGLLDILVENRVWLEKFPILVAISVYTYLRVIVDHGNPALSQLRQREVDFCMSLIKEKWTEVYVIGRDLVRLLQDVARIPEFEKLWRDILYNPSNVHPTFKGLTQLMQMRTSKRYFVSRLTPDMENKLAFLTTKVKFGQQKRYQDWFQKQYLSTPESQSLRCDLIRYICAVIHPTNEILCSDIIPRWAVIGWLLTTCTTNVVASNAKLALFYDWLFFDPGKDSIMNIEPCVLVMFHSIRPHPAITVTLLDFMCRIMPNFYPPLFTEVKQGIFTALRTIVEKKVLQSLAPLFDNAKLDKELRSMIREHFSEFCASEIKDEPMNNSKSMKNVISYETGDTPSYLNLSDGHYGSDMATFSDDEEDLPVEKVPKIDSQTHFRPIVEPPKFEAVDISQYLDQLDGLVRTCVEDLQSESTNELQCEMMDRLMQAIIQDPEFDQDCASNLAICLSQILLNQFNNNLFPKDPDEEAIEDSISAPLFVIFRNLCQTPEEDPSRQPLLLLLEEFYSKQPRLGYHFLYFLKVSKTQTEGRMGPYKDFCKSMEKDIDSCIMADLELCQEDDVRLFTYFIPDIYSQFPNIAIGNADLLHLIVSCIDGIQLQDLICEILRSHLVMFKKDSFVSILNASLEWETIEQYFLWQLIASHNIPVEQIMPVLPKLEYSAHAEALTSIMIQLKLEGPSQDLLRPLLCRECKKTDMFSVSVLKFWAQEWEDKLADLLHTFTVKSTNTTNTGTPTRKRHRNQSNKGKEKEQPSIDNILGHLEQFRQYCKNISFLMNEQIQQALQHVQTTCQDSFKSRFSDLLALAEDLDDIKSTRVLRAVPSRRASAAAHKHGPTKGRGKTDDSDTSEESTEDEEIIKPKSKKAKKSTIILDDDD